MNGCLEGWWVDGWWIDGWWMDGWMNELMNEWTDRWMDWWMDRKNVLGYLPEWKALIDCRHCIWIELKCVFSLFLKDHRHVRQDVGITETLVTVTGAIITIDGKVCKDHLINGVECTAIPTICDDSYGREICARTCHQCGGYLFITPHLQLMGVGMLLSVLLFQYYCPSVICLSACLPDCLSRRL
jgi:hypothetical protein